MGAGLGGTDDPFFRRPLWLQTCCVGRILRAYDEKHIVEPGAYVNAALRQQAASPTIAMVAASAAVNHSGEF
ncbi:hypothetical protein ACFVQ4_32940 [Streptomyces laurentii]|uniref:hypothetical protein n=1 Tax=Streptomyces laurentii TaxID=39478 RepID=UPI0036B23932